MSPEQKKKVHKIRGIVLSAAKAPKAVRVTRWSILSGAVLAIAIGLLGGGAAAVIANAIAICTSCIGLG